MDALATNERYVEWLDRNPGGSWDEFVEDMEVYADKISDMDR